jgi:hypothetical protein
MFHNPVLPRQRHKISFTSGIVAVRLKRALKNKKKAACLPVPEKNTSCGQA